MDWESSRCRTNYCCMRPFVVIESPFAGDIRRNVHYADCLMMDSLQRGESPYLGHLLYPRVFDDSDPKMREAGIQAHMAVIDRADIVVVGMDLGSPTVGMMKAIMLAESIEKTVARRYLGPGWAKRYTPRPTPQFMEAGLYARTTGI